MVSPARLFCIAASRSLPSTLWLRVFINRICCARIETRAVRRPTFVMTSRIAIHSRRTRIAEAAIWRRDQTLEPFELYAQQPGLCARKRFGIRRLPPSTTVAQCRGLLYGTRYVSLRPSSP